MHETVIERLAPEAGDELLDLACGTGAVAELAAERGAQVTGVDLAPVLIATAKERAAERGHEIDYRVGDAEQLDFPEASWELFSSSYGPTKTLAESLGERRAELERDWVEFFESTYRQGDEIVHAREYLLVLGRRR